MNFEGGTTTYPVDVTATDPAGLSNSIRVTITVLDDEDEPPAITGTASSGATRTEVGSTEVYSLPEATTVDIPGVATFRATDPDDGDATVDDLSLSGEDAGDFTITSGALAFKALPNYERPADADMNNVYKVRVVASDSDDNRGNKDVEIRVSNAGEPGVVALSAVQARVGVSLRASLTDPDGGISNVTWQWENGADAIAKATSATYTPTAEDAGDILTAKAMYTDAAGADNEAMKESGAVATDTRNKAPKFEDQDPDTEGTQNTVASRSVAENTAAVATDDPADETDDTADNVSDAVTAGDDNDNDLPTYTLSGPDAASFRVRNDGQIEVAAGTTLNYEAKSTYMVTVTATDSFGLSASIAVTINVTDLNEGPAITGTSEVEYVENGTGSVAAFTATDPENAGSIIWSLKDVVDNTDDKGDFTIDAGVLSFKKSPDYEAPAGGGPEGTSTTYMVTVVATDADFQTSEKAVTVELANRDEAGTVSLTSMVNVDINNTPTVVTVTVLAPHPGNAIDAALSDPDGRERDMKWQWSRSSTRSGSYINITNADKVSYMPTAGDVGYYLRATATYEDREGDGKSAMATTAHKVQAIRSPNAAPAFPDQDATTTGIQNETATRTVLENAEAGARVGDRVEAADANNDILSYALAGTDAASFKIDPANGQIMVGAMTELDFEANNIDGEGDFTVDVTATDPAGMSTSISVTINVMDDQDEPPAITGTVPMSVAENVTDLVVVSLTGD